MSASTARGAGSLISGIAASSAWLVPKSEGPFALAGYYDDHPLFDEDFRRAFSDNYRLVDSSKNFDIWECRAPEPKF
jgi:hypothetical protein